ncbi:MAG: DNA photolyase family protein [Candidatus Nanopelagicales bacterium]|nr:DNA photolyase family protein [Candidatus Nanopelagicales bacterium]MDP5050782.1 DNA photolyase family protein [Candidatus Nanopelagicales bacterium]
MTSVLWFRRDLRVHDNPALVAATEAAWAAGDGNVVAVVLIDPALWPTWGPAKQAYLIDSLTSLDAALGGNLVIRHGKAQDVIPAIAKEFQATSVHCAADYSGYGIARDNEIAATLEKSGIDFVKTGSGYAVAPGRVTKDDATYYKVYTPFYKRWLIHGWRAPAADPAKWPNWIGAQTCDGYPPRPDTQGVLIPAAGEAAALELFETFLAGPIENYSDDRNRPDLAGTSKLSIALKWGEIHPRTLLARLGDSSGHEVFRKEIAWREFYAEIAFQRPETITDYFNPLYAQMKYDTGKAADEKFAAWCNGQTGYPFVDAGMRQLRTEGWMHNRVRMVVASFLLKDLHIEWQRGANYFFEWLLDGDLASNSHGWQWTAGCGTDASPYYRVFNPLGQGAKFDPNGDYVRKYIPELAHIPGVEVHEPWKVLGGLDHGYPEPIVDHGAERLEALDRLSKLPKGVQQAINPKDKDVPKTKKRTKTEEAKLIHDFE